MLVKINSRISCYRRNNFEREHMYTLERFRTLDVDFWNWVFRIEYHAYGVVIILSLQHNCALRSWVVWVGLNLCPTMQWDGSFRLYCSSYCKVHIYFAINSSPFPPAYEYTVKGHILLLFVQLPWYYQQTRTKCALCRDDWPGNN